MPFTVIERRAPLQGQQMIELVSRIGLTIGLLSLTWGCLAYRKGATPRSEGGRVVRAMTSEPANLDPQGPPSSGLNLILPYLFDTLVVRDATNQIHPLLAEHWAMGEQGKVLTMTLKANVTFHDGTPLDADAVLRTFRRLAETGTASPIYDGIQQIRSVDVVDAHTVRFQFAEPSPTFWSTISMPYASILSPDSIEQATTDPDRPLVGSGPFRLRSWDPGRAITLESNPDYAWSPPIVENQEAPHLAELTFRIIPDATTQLLALQSGEVDILFVNQPEHLRALENDQEITLHSAVLNSLVYLGFNCAKPPLDEPAIRRALSHAVDKQEILDLALGGIGQVAFAPLPPTLEGFDSGLQTYASGYDPDQAIKGLETAGFTRTVDNGWERATQTLALELLISTRAPNADIAALLQSQFKAVGVPVIIRQVDSRAVMQTTAEGAYDLLLWRYDWNDPDALRIFFSSPRIGRTNRIYYSNPLVDALLEEGAHTLDNTARQRIYSEAQRLMLLDAPLQPLYNPVDVIAVRNRVVGAQVSYMGRLLLNDVRIAASTP